MTETLSPLCFPSFVEWLLGHRVSGEDAPGTVPSRKRRRTRLQQTRKTPTPTAASAPHLADPTGARRAPGPQPRVQLPADPHPHPAGPSTVTTSQKPLHHTRVTGQEVRGRPEQGTTGQSAKTGGGRERRPEHTKSGAPRAPTAGVPHAGQRLPPKIVLKNETKRHRACHAGVRVSPGPGNAPFLDGFPRVKTLSFPTLFLNPRTAGTPLWGAPKGWSWAGRGPGWVKEIPRWGPCSRRFL